MKLTPDQASMTGFEWSLKHDEEENWEKKKVWEEFSIFNIFASYKALVTH